MITLIMMAFAIYGGARACAGAPRVHPLKLWLVADDLRQKGGQ